MTSTDKRLKFQGSAALLDGATRRMEAALADELSDAVCMFFYKIATQAKVDAGRHADISVVLSNFLGLINNVPRMSAEDARAAVDEVLQGVEMSDASLQEVIEALFINRARIFSASKIGTGGEIDVRVPDVQRFMHQVLVCAAQLFATKPRIFYATKETANQDRAALRETVAHEAVRRALDVLQPPSQVARGQKAKAAAAATAKAPLSHASAAERRSAAAAAAAADRAERASLKSMGFHAEPEPVVAEEDEQDDDADDQQDDDDDDNDDGGDDGGSAEANDVVVGLPADPRGPQLSAAKHAPAGHAAKDRPVKPRAPPSDQMSVLSQAPLKSQSRK